MAKRKLTEKQKQKLRDSEFARSNSSDLTINPSWSDSLEYDDDGSLSYDRRTKEGKKIDKILKSKNRSSSKNEEEDYEDESDDSGNDYIDIGKSIFDDGSDWNDDSNDDDGDWDYDLDDEEDAENDWNEEEAYPDDYVNNRGDNYEYIRENVTIDDNDSGEEVAVCPECKDIMMERDAEEQHGDIFNFECHCGHSFSAELHNEICETCERLVSVHRVIKYESFNFCCENCKSLFLDPPDDDSGITPFSDGVSNCTYCNKSGICKNGDNPYYFDQGCPGECSFYYRK